MFTLKQRLPVHPVGVGMNVISSVTEETGFVEKHKLSFADVLPQKELFDPTACVKAGKNLDLVESKVLGFSFDAGGNETETLLDSSSEISDSTSNDFEV